MLVFNCKKICLICFHVSMLNDLSTVVHSKELFSCSTITMN